MMKKAFAAMALVAMTMSAQATVVINEGFENVAGLAASGWVFIDNSTPGGITPGWFQGTTGPFSAQSGDVTSYAAANFTNVTVGGTIDNWLLTPEFNASGGVDISFYLRAAGDGYADQISYGFMGVGATMTTVNPVPDSGWTLYNVHLDANSMGTTRFAFQYGGTSDSANYVGLDSVTVDVPEPASIPLLAGGLLGLGAIRRRSRG
jgi:hypothetical protein